MKHNIKPEPTYNSEMINGKSKGLSLEESGNELMKAMIQSFAVGIETLALLKEVNPGYKFTIGHISQRYSRLSDEISDLRQILYGNLNSGKNGEKAQ